MSERAAERVPGRRGRKAATVVVLGLLALGGLSACRTDAGTAVFVGDTRITQAYVNGTAGSVDPKKLATVNITPAQARTLVAQYATFNALASRYAKAKGYTTPPLDTSEVSGIATALSVPTDKIASNPFIKVIAQGDAWSTYLLAKTPTRAPSEADARQMYDDLMQAGYIKSTTSFDTVKDSLLQALPTAGTANELRTALDAEAKQLGVSVNPMYAGACFVPKCDGLTFPLASIQNGSSNIPVMLVNMGGTASPAVFDQIPAATESAAPAQ